MQLECKECHKILNLPDAKLPVGRTFAFNCPYCKQKNTAFIPDQEAETAAPPSPPPAALEPRGKTAPPPPSPMRVNDGGMAERPKYEAESEDLQAVLSEFVDGRPKAIVVYDDPETQELLLAKLEGSGYNAMAALNPRDAAKQLKFANFALLVLQENYCGASLRGNLLLKSVQVMDIGNRRGMLVVLISPTMVTLDDLTAFSLSIDAIINVSDFDHLDRLLVSSTARAKKFHAVYREILAEHGLD